MHRVIPVVALLLFALALGASNADAATGPIYGFSFQWSRDADGDGIPNHLDEDWVRPENGTGYQMKHKFSPLLTCFTAGASDSGETLRLRWQHRSGNTGTDGDQVRNRNRNRLGDGSGDQVRLRTRERACR